MISSRAALLSALVLAACGSGTGVSPAPGPSPAAKATASPTSSNVARAEDDDEAIARAQKDYLALLLDISPETATSLGVHDRDSELDDRTEAGHEMALAREEKMLGALERRFASPRASRAAKTDLALLLAALRVDVRTKRAQRPLARNPDLYASPLGAIFAMTSREYGPPERRARDVLSRLGKIPTVVDAAKKNLREPPRVWTEIAIAQAASAGGFLDGQKGLLLRALPAEAAHIDRALAAAKAAYAEYQVFLQKEVLPRSTGKFAAGRELFEFLLKNDYALAESADELLAVGKRIFAETNSQMNGLAKRIDPKAKGWPEVAQRLKTRHPTAAGLLDAYRSEVGRARLFAMDRNIVAMPPGDDLEIIETPPFLRSVISAAYDRPPPFDAGTKGFFFVTPIDTGLPRAKQEQMLREHDHGDLVDTAVHEAYPGHHLQLSFARRHPSLIRKIVDQSIFSEGWALYCEELMAELGYYTDEERLLQLEWTLVRAARVVIDVGLHTGDMTFEQAVSMLTDQVHLERPLAVSEVKRYTMTPTQPLSYLVGRQKLFELRERYRARAGERFTLLDFHRDVLAHGTISPVLVAKEIFEGD